MDYPKSQSGVNLLNGKFTDGNPLLGVPASRDPAGWANAVTDEILAVLAAAEIAPNEADNTQLVQAIGALITNAIPAAPDNASETVKGVVELATAAEVIAGTDSARAVTAAALAALTALTTRRGLVELATEAETRTGTDSARAVTPAGLESARPSKARCTAWVNFNGTGTVSIRDSYNVSSVVDNGTGAYTVNFAAEMNSVGYSVGTAAHTTESASAAGRVAEPYDLQLSSFKVAAASSSAGSVADCAIICCNVFGGD
jgi:hypothetical protein